MRVPVRRLAAMLLGPVILPLACAHAEPPVPPGYLQDRWARADLQALAGALRAHQAEHGRWPAGDPGDALAPHVAPVPRTDPWGTAYRFDLREDLVQVVSAGPDRAFATGDDLVERLVGGPTTVADARTAPRPAPEGMLRTRDVLHRLARALETWRERHGHYPPAADLDALREALVPEAMAAPGWSSLDAWGHELRYRADATGASYVLASPGSDGTFEEGALPEGPVTGSERDLVVADGRFVRWPAEGEAGPTAARDRTIAASAAPTPPAAAATPADAGGDDERARTVAALRALAGRLAEHRRSAGRYPENDDVARLAQDLGGPVETSDAWGHRLTYVSYASGTGYVLASPGPDGRLDHSIDRYIGGAAPADGPGRDVAVRNGEIL